MFSITVFNTMSHISKYDISPKYLRKFARLFQSRLTAQSTDTGQWNQSLKETKLTWIDWTWGPGV